MAASPTGSPEPNARPRGAPSPALPSPPYPHAGEGKRDKAAEPERIKLITSSHRVPPPLNQLHFYVASGSGRREEPPSRRGQYEAPLRNELFVEYGDIRAVPPGLGGPGVPPAPDR